VFQSKADFQNFALELSKKMKIRYVSPPKPIDLTVKGGLSNLMIPSAGAPQGVDRDGDDEKAARSDSFDALSEIDHAVDDVAAMFNTKLPPRRFEM
jgi:hypothetical protein